MASKTTPTEVRQITRADVDAHRLALRRIEGELHRYAEADTSQEPDHKGRRRFWASSVATWINLDDETECDAYERGQLAKVARIIGFRPIGLFINGDPRGYALKINEEHAGDLHKDWGGYGIVAPDKDS